MRKSTIIKVIFMKKKNINTYSYWIFQVKQINLFEMFELQISFSLSSLSSDDYKALEKMYLFTS